MAGPVPLLEPPSNVQTTADIGDNHGAVACAVFCGDEETCVAVARFFMRDERYAPDSYRLFTALCRACQAPVSWYASGPAQKFILRQIKAMDARLSQAQRETGRAGAPGAPGREATAADEGLQDREDGGSIAANLLMLYGHIMFTSTSYVYALSSSRPSLLIPTGLR